MSEELGEKVVVSLRKDGVHFFKDVSYPIIGMRRIEQVIPHVEMPKHTLCVVESWFDDMSINIRLVVR